MVKSLIIFFLWLKFDSSQFSWNPKPLRLEWLRTAAPRTNMSKVYGRHEKKTALQTLQNERQNEKDSTFTLLVWLGFVFFSFFDTVVISALPAFTDETKNREQNTRAHTTTKKI